MMFRGLQVTSFTGDSPTPRQMLLRSAGYILSAGTFFLGFFWAWWDADALTWHDRLSQTYLSVLPTHEDLKSSAMAPATAASVSALKLCAANGLAGHECAKFLCRHSLHKYASIVL